MTLYYPLTKDFSQGSLGAELLTATTSSATLNTTATALGIQNKAGVMIIDRIDANGTETATKCEVISFAGTSGSTVTTLVRGLGGTTAQDHATGAIVEFGPDIVWAQGLIDTFVTEHGTDGTHDNTKVAMLAGAQTFTGEKTFTTGLLKAPDITVGSAKITLPTTADTLVGRDTTDTLTNKTLTAPLVNVGSDAAMDVYYRNADGTFTRLAAGTSGQMLMTKGTGTAPAWVTPSKAYSVTAGSQSTTSSSYSNITGGTVSVVVDVKSNVFVMAYSLMNHTSATAVYLKVVYDSTDVGVESYTKSTATETVTAGGVVTNLAAGTYTFAMQKKVYTNGQTGTYDSAHMAILVVPALT